MFWFHHLRSFFLKLNKYLTVYTTSVPVYNTSQKTTRWLTFGPSFSKINRKKVSTGHATAMFAFKIKVSIIKFLKMMQWNYQLNKAKLTDLWVRNYASGCKVSRTFKKQAPELKCISSCHFWQREVIISNFIIHVCVCRLFS